MKIYCAAALFNSDSSFFAPGALVVEGSKIVDLGAAQSMKEKYPRATCQDYPKSFILPGLVDAHGDCSLEEKEFSQAAFQESFHGDYRFIPWVIEISRYKSHLSMEKQISALSAGLARAKSLGITTLGDVCRYPIALREYEKSKLNLVVLAEIENIQRLQAQEDFEQALALAEEVASLGSARLFPGLAPFSAYTLSKHLLRLIGDHAFHQQWPLHLQASLSFAELEFFYDSMGEIPALLFKEAGWQEKVPPPHRMTPLAFLKEIGFLKKKPSLIGALNLGPSDQNILAEQNILRVFSPQAFKNLHAIKMDWQKIYQEKTPWAWASLGKAWGANLNPWEEMALILESFAEFSKEVRESVAFWLLKSFSYQGAKALGLEKQKGLLKAAWDADFVVLSTGDKNASSLAHLMAGSPVVEEVYIGGTSVND